LIIDKSEKTLVHGFGIGILYPDLRSGGAVGGPAVGRGLAIGNADGGR